MRLFLIISLLCCVLWGQTVDMRRAAATARPGGVANVQEPRDFGNGQRGLDLSCVFTASPDCKRASWDIPINMDLSQISGLKLCIRCQNLENVSQYSVYVRSGNVWYSADYQVGANGVWQDIFIPKTDFRKEGGGEASWQNCNVLRLVMWKGSAGLSRINLAQAEFIRPNASVALLRPSGSEKQGRAAMRAAKNLNDALVGQGLRVAVIDEGDLAYSTLRLYRMLLVPYPDALDNEQTNTLISCMRGGCKAGLFHALSPRLAAQMGTPTGKYTQLEGGRSLGWLVPVGKLLPNVPASRHAASSFIAVESLPASNRVVAVWADSAQQFIGKPALIESNSGFWMTHTYLNQEPDKGGLLWLAVLSHFLPDIQRSAAYTCLQEAGSWYSMQSAEAKSKSASRLNNAQGAFNAGKYTDCIAQCREARQSVAVNTGGKTQMRRGELRGVWCKHPNGLPGRGWSATASLLAARKYNLVLPYAAAPHFAAYESRIVPVSAGNGLPECTAACHKLGIAVHAWVNCLDVEEAPDALVARWRAAGRLQVDVSGKSLKWLCPANAENRQMLSRLVAELVSKNDVDGVQFDRIRYPGSEACFCLTCKAAFEKYTGLNCSNWPADVRSGEYRGRWQDFRVVVINSLLAEMINSARTAKSKVLVSAAVYSDPGLAKANVGQDWGPWLKNKWLSFASPMNYVGNSTQYNALLQRQINVVGGRERLVPGIGLTPCRLDDNEVSRQIDAVRMASLPGFVVFDLR